MNIDSHFRNHILKDITMPPRPRIYCASPYPRAKMWRMRGDSTLLGPDVEVVSTWHNNGDEASFSAAQTAARWEQDFKEVVDSDALLAYAEFGDRPQGTLIEIGYALSYQIPVHIVGSYPWGTWKYFPLVTEHKSLREAVLAITRAAPKGAAEGSSA